MNRGIIYIIWGKLNDESKKSLNRSQESLVQLGLKHEIFHGTGYKSKCDMFDLSPFDETAFLDIDTVVMGDLSYGFDAARKYGLALVIAPACLATRHWDIKKNNPKLTHLSDDIIEYNSGVMFFTKTDKTLALAESWRHYSKLIPKQFPCDQNALSIACWEIGFNPYVLTKNWNYRHLDAPFKGSLFGPVKIWHSYSKVPEWIKKHNKSGSGWVLDKSN